MKRNLCVAAMLACAVGGALSAAPGRRIALDEKDVAPGVTRFLSQAIELADGARETWVTVTRTGEFTDPRYGKFSITLAMLEQMVANFNQHTLGVDVFMDVAHKPSDGAAGKFVKLAVQGNKLRALVEWTPYGVDAIKQRGFAYVSAEYHENYTDNEGGKAHGCVLLGAGLTPRPVVKHLDPVTLSLDDNDQAEPVRLAISPQLLKELSEQSMNKFLKQLLERLITLGFTDVTAKPFLDAATPQITAAGEDEPKALALVDAFFNAGDAAMKQIKALGNPTGPVTIQLSMPTPAVDVTGAVAKALADRDKAEADARTALAGKVKLLSDTITAGDKTLTAEHVTALAADYTPMVTAATTDDQVKHLAAMALKQAQAISAARKLAGLGYNPPSGSVHIEVSSGGVLKLQAETDRRLGLEGEADNVRRFYNTGGKLLATNKAFAEKALAQFDATRGAELEAEVKALAAGTSITSDVKVPVAFERTVLREQLYNLTSLNFMDTGTYPFAETIQIPYSYRDTTAAGVNQLRVYERGAIQNAGVTQVVDSAYPIPQKLGFNVSNEMRYLLGAANIDFEPLAENARNVIRIVGEDTEALNMNEHIRASDEYLATAIVAENLGASVNGTNKTFCLAQFPVVRPRKYFDVRGAQIGSTLNPIVVTLNSVVRSEYDGTGTQAAGTYYTMDYNLGELRFVTELGASVTPTNAWPLTVSYSWTANVSKFDTDLGSLSTRDKYDLLLIAIGNRKVVISNDRYYNPSMVVMSAAVDNMLTQADTFRANGARVGTSLNPDGSVGVTKGIGTFNTTAPGLYMGDARILIGERFNARFRMIKAFAMNQLEQAKDSTGKFIGALAGYGEQFIACHTPVNRKNAFTTIVLYSATGRVTRTT